MTAPKTLPGSEIRTNHVATSSEQEISFVSGFNLSNPPTPSVPTLDRSLLENFELIEDLARYGEGLFTREQVKKKWRKLVSNEMWDTLGSNDELVDRIENEKVRRVRDGSAKREKAQKLIVKGPEILDGIATNPKASDKHKIDAVRALDRLAGNSPDAASKKR
jgi:hypothetical protein